MLAGAYYVAMGRPFDKALSPTPHYYEIRGRAAEIARTLGSQIGGAEHLFLGMLPRSAAKSTCAPNRWAHAPFARKKSR